MQSPVPFGSYEVITVYKDMLTKMRLNQIPQMGHICSDAVLHSKKVINNRAKLSEGFDFAGQALSKVNVCPIQKNWKDRQQLSRAAFPPVGLTVRFNALF